MIISTNRAPARVQGSEQRALAIFIEDKRGDLVDIDYECFGCADPLAWDAALPWPGYEFSTDYATHCAKCHELIQQPR